MMDPDTGLATPGAAEITDAAHPGPVPPVRDRLRVLIVDDELPNRQLLEAMLDPEGFTLLTATGGEEALAMVADEPPDLILLDVMMPGVNGYEVADSLKANQATRHIPIVMVTALRDRDARLRGLGTGVEDFVSRPVDHTELRMRVRNLLRLKEFGDYREHYTHLLESEVIARTSTLAESERLYRSTFDAAPVGIVHIGLDGKWLRVNQRLCDLLAMPAAELQTTAGRERVDSGEAAGEAEAFRQMAAGTLDLHVTEDKRFRRGDGSVMWARVKMSLHRDADGQPKHIISVIEDITERRTLEIQVRQTGKMDAIGRLASGVAHDFNNLLTVILGCTAEVSADAGLAGRHGEDLAEITSAAQRAAGLTRQLLAYSRQQILLAGPLDVNELIRNMSGMLGRLIGERIQVTLGLASDLSLAFADRGQIEQVVMNLVLNARDAMPEGGTLRMETANVALGEADFHEETAMEGEYVMFAITDNGTGMTTETQRRLFEPFYTTKVAGEGTGLGLSTTYGIVKQSKGYIWVTSEIGHGTTFKVYLPCAPACASAT